jgi:ankyrin repeat protein
LEVVKVLLKYKCGVSVRAGDEYTPLTMAIRAGKVEVVKLLLESGADATTVS